ncbi:MAG: exodeoxyribonuclease VII small subunit [Gemmatimonadota bacterium]|nr:exodeoxyribonuclease VII small subunit [Gemmatimonadota bacterium]
MTKKKPSFKEELERLEAIVRKLENSEVDLDEGLKIFQEGVERLKTARKLLKDAEITVHKVVRGAEGDLGEDGE